jgi:hypothetical protein
MSHFAKINSDNIVVNIIVAEQDFINSGILGDSFLWVQTSYNGNFRNKYANIGDTWDRLNDVFISAQPHESWTLSDDFAWHAPVEYPTTVGVNYIWDEAVGNWVEMVEVL